jgi:hypothetical protein
MNDRFVEQGMDGKAPIAISIIFSLANDPAAAIPKEVLQRRLQISCSEDRSPGMNNTLSKRSTMIIPSKILVSFHALIKSSVFRYQDNSHP